MSTTLDITNKDILTYCEAHISPETRVLEELNRETHLKMIYPRMLSGNMQGKFLSMLVKIMQPNYILEIGTFTGYSAICMAKDMPDTGVLHTIEKNPEYEDRIIRFFEKAGVNQKIVLHIGLAENIIPTLPDKIDLAFIDADKENYVTYYELLVKKMVSGSIMIADNVLWNGKVLDPKNNKDKETSGLIKFNETVQQDERTENLMLPIRDGLMLIIKK